MFAGDVQAQYGELTHEAVDIVIMEFSKITYPVRSPRAYLRTALYNAAIYGEAKLINDVNGM